MLSSETQTLSLRDVEKADLPAFFEHQLDPQANHMAAFTAEHSTDRAAFDAHWQKILDDPAIVKKAVLLDGRVIGHVLAYSQFGQPSVCYWLDRAHWNQGIASRALSAFLAQHDSRPLFALAAKDNIASIRVLQKCGFTLIGHSRGYANVRGHEIDEVALRLD